MRTRRKKRGTEWCGGEKERAKGRGRKEGQVRTGGMIRGDHKSSMIGEIHGG